MNILNFTKYKHKYISVLIATFLIFTDYFTKIAAEKYIPKNITVTVIPHLIDFRFLKNDGAAFGMLDNARWVFMLATFVFIIIGAIYFLHLKKNQKFTCYVVMLILAGGIGNMVDRIFYGEVVDFITFGFMDFPSFNIADCCVVIGCFMWIISILFDVKNQKANTK